MADLSLVELLAGGDPDGWKEFFPNYEPNNDVRVQKARAISQGIGPQERALAVDETLSDRSAAFQSTPLSDSDVELTREVTGGRLDLGDVREVPGVIVGDSGTFQSLAEAEETLAEERQQADTSSGDIVDQAQRARSPNSNTQRPESGLDAQRDTLANAVEDREDREDRENREDTGGQGRGTVSSDSGGVESTPRTDALSQAGIGVQGQTPLGNEPEGQPETASDDEGDESVDDFQGETIEPDVVIENVNIPGNFVTELKPKPNILSEFSSYTYSVSMYLTRAEDYRNMVQTGEKKLFNSTLLVQSGGIKTPENSRRNPYFDVDFYIDDLEINSLVTGKANQGAHNATTLRFSLTEPYGISFLDRLRDAVVDYKGSDENPFSQIYLMVIRFYGYDEAGNLVRPENKAEETTDSNAVIEKFIPFIWRNITFTVQNQSVVYSCEAVSVNQYVGLGQLYSKIPYNIEISGQSLSEILNGETVFSSTDDTPGPPDEDDDNAGDRKSQRAATLKQGLVAALNRYEKSEAAEKGALPNEYDIILDESSGLANAKMAQFDEAYLANLPIGNRTNQTLAQKTSNDNTRRKYSLIAGQPIVQVLDLLIRASTYITDQQLVKITEDPAVDRGVGPTVEKAKKYARLRDSSQGPVAWYKITTHIEPKEYDHRRNEHSYKITYIISSYQVNDLVSEYFPKARFRGVHKEYDYWFTGENTEVLNFEQQYNSLYYIRMAPQSVLSEAGIDPRTNREGTVKGTTQDTSDQSEVMGSGESARPSADAASSLYSPADQATAELKILGDPAWIQQSEILYNNIKEIDYNPFLPDNSVNYDSQEPLFKLTFNLPTDYDIDGTGIMPINNFNKKNEEGIGNNEYIYRANRIVNTFSGGVFTQNISATFMDEATKENLNRGSEIDRLDNDRPGADLLNNIIFPGTPAEVGESKNVDTFGPRNGPFGISGIDVTPDNSGLNDD